MARGCSYWHTQISLVGAIYQALSANLGCFVFKTNVCVNDVFAQSPNVDHGTCASQCQGDGCCYLRCKVNLLTWHHLCTVVSFFLLLNSFILDTYFPLKSGYLWLGFKSWSLSECTGSEWKLCIHIKSVWKVNSIISPIFHNISPIAALVINKDLWGVTSHLRAPQMRVDTLPCLHCNHGGWRSRGSCGGRP